MLAIVRAIIIPAMHARSLNIATERAAREHCMG